MPVYGSAAPLSGSPQDGLRQGRRAAVASVIVSAALAVLNVLAGLRAGSVSVVAIGVEFAGDVLASCVVLIGLFVASRPPDANHPYGHGRLEIVAGLFVGFVLMVGGVGIVVRSMTALREPAMIPGALAIASLLIAMAARAVMSAIKFSLAQRIGSLALRSDAWNDAVDILSGVAALIAVLLVRFDPGRFAAADAFGGAIVGVIVVWTGLRVVRLATIDLADTMPDPGMIAEARRVALAVPGVVAVEKQFARKTGLQYHIDLHIEVDPDMTVRESHRIGHDVQAQVREALPWVADVLVHVEPAGGVGDGRAARRPGS